MTLNCMQTGTGHAQWVVSNRRQLTKIPKEDNKEIPEQNRRHIRARLTEKFNCHVPTSCYTAIAMYQCCVVLLLLVAWNIEWGRRLNWFDVRERIFRARLCKTKPARAEYLTFLSFLSEERNNVQIAFSSDLVHSPQQSRIGNVQD